MTRSVLGPALALALLVTPALGQYPKTPPEPGPLTPAAFPPFQETTLPNGLRILVVESRKQPIVSMSLSFPAGAAHEPAGKEGVADMVATLLTKGAGNRTAEQIAETVEGSGGSLGASAGNDFMRISATALTPNLELAFELMADAVMRPTFPESEIDLLRTQTLSNLQVELSQPDAIASRAFFKAIYGDHPYGRQETPATIRAITRDDIVAFHERLKPSGSLMVLAGDISLEQARSLAMRAFRGWIGAPPELRRAAIPNRASTELLLVHRPGSVQSNILVGNLTFGPTDQRVYPATVANQILGGGTDSRLFLILREEKSWTYGAYSNLARRMDRGFFIASAEVRTEVTDSALKELLKQVNRIRTEPVSAEELQAALGSLVGSYPLSIETADQVAGAVATARLYGLPEDYVQTYRVKLGAVTADALRVAAENTIQPDKSVIVVVGDGSKIYEGIKDIAPMRILDPEGNPLTVDDIAAPKMMALPFDVSKIVPHRDSFVVMVQGNEFGYYTGELTSTADGFRYAESTRLGGFVEQDTEVLMDKNLSALAVNQSGTVQGMETKIAVTFSGGRAKGEATTPGPQGMQSVTIDTTVADGVIDDNVLQLLLPGLAWGPDATWSFSTFSSGSGETHLMTLGVSGTETVTTPAGAVEAYRADVTGGPQGFTFWVSTAEPHQLMKIAIAGTPVEMLRAQ